MTVETEVANLTTAVNSLTTAVDVKKATLDASVVDAEAAAVETLGYRDTANLHKLAAEAAATSATNTAAALVGFDLEAIAANKAVTAVDVFVYDTSKDSDGGAWRKRTQGTSWYQETLNTATRGSRKDFPAVAVIVAEANKVTIYDGDEPALPMWMVFNDVAATLEEDQFWRAFRTATSVSAFNGMLLFGTDGASASGLHIANFVSDKLSRYDSSSANTGTFSGGVVLRDSTNNKISPSLSTIVNNTVNDVAMTVLPDAPIDAATGLPIPTIAVATAGGVSVITDSGAVYDSSQTFPINHVTFRDDGAVLYRRTGSPEIYASETYASDGFGVRIYDFDLQPYSFLSGSSGAGFASTGANLFVGRNVGLETYLENTSSLTNSMVAYTTKDYNTGWMNGDIKGAFLSDTDTSSLVASGELVTNGTFDTDVIGWAAASDGRCTISWQAGKLRISNVTASLGYAFQTVSTVVGKNYTIQWTPSQVSTAYSTRVYWGNAEGSTSGGGASPFAVLSGPQSITFVATTTTTYVAVQLGSATVGAEYDFDNISVKLADADRSVNNNGLIVNGTVTRTPVATGADLVAYSGFSASNYLEAPYNADLDFGTGDFCVMGWVKTAAADTGVFFSRGDIALAGTRWWFGQLSGVPYVYSSLGSITGAGSIPVNSWSHVVFMRLDDVCYFYINGALVKSVANTYNLTNTSAVSRTGLTYSGANAFTGSLALLRISATAPTAEQIAKIYEDEKVLFQENAQATLYGTSDAVTALAHDDATNLLHVGTSAGRSAFQGLRRVSNTTTAVGTAISASNGLVVEE